MAQRQAEGSKRLVGVSHGRITGGLRTTSCSRLKEINTVVAIGNSMTRQMAVNIRLSNQRSAMRRPKKGLACWVLCNCFCLNIAFAPSCFIGARDAQCADDQ